MPSTESRSETSLRRQVMADLRAGGLRSSLRRDVRDLYRFYVDDERRADLDRMGRVRRAFTLGWWVLRNMLLRLSPPRRVLLVLAIVLLFTGEVRVGTAEVQLRLSLAPWSAVLVLVVLMLELKDKLLARDEIAVARQVQRALLPEALPGLPGWDVWGTTRPANDVGGDLVDALPAPGGRLALVLGDVAGKGLGAALLMAKLQATVRAVAADHGTLDALGRRLNAILCQDGIPNRYATLVYLEIAPGDGEVRYLNAGHNPPLRVRADGIQQLPASSWPLGMLDGPSYAEGRLLLEPGELLVLYSDGLVEARDGSGAEYGDARLAALAAGLRGLPAGEAGRRILADVEAHLGEERPHDDLSLVVLSPRATGGPSAR